MKPLQPELPDEGDERAARPFAPDLHDVRHLWLKGVLLTVWAMASFGVCFFARDLLFSVGDWPVGFWMASQGAVFVFLAIVVVYAMAMSRFERADESAARRAAAGTESAPAAPLPAPPARARSTRPREERAGG